MSPGRRRTPVRAGSPKRRGFGRTWWGVAWVDALEDRARLDPNRLPRGRTYARSGAVGELQLAPGEVVAAVQGRRTRPYQVRVRVRQFTGTEWDRLLDAVAGQVGHAAALLEGELPPAVLDDVAVAGLELLPGPGDLQPRCSCPDWADPCKHAAAVCYLVADSLDADPFALLLLRGRARDEVLTGMRTRRGGTGTTRTPKEPDRDSGIPAREAYAAAGRPLPSPLPVVPVPPPRPGRPVPLIADAPAGSPIDGATLTALATDAAIRAHELALGGGDGGLGLDRAADLARRASSLIGSLDFDPLARRVGLPGRELLRRALAWRYGGPSGLATLVNSWQPESEDLTEGRAVLGSTARGWRNRVTAGPRQLRLDPEGRWHPYRRVAGDWDPAGPPDPDPAVAAAEL